MLPLALHQQPFFPMKPCCSMAPQDTKPLERKHYEDVRLAGHLEDDIKDSPSSHGLSTTERFLQELIEIHSEQQRHSESVPYLQESHNEGTTCSAKQAFLVTHITEQRGASVWQGPRQLLQLRFSSRQKPMTARCAYTILGNTLMVMSMIKWKVA